jgi:hypothetical protein
MGPNFDIVTTANPKQRRAPELIVQIRLQTETRTAKLRQTIVV